MKRFLLYLLALTPFSAFAQLSGSGYYRVQNTSTERYISIVDTRASIGASNADLQALHMLKSFEDSVAYNPATICYVELVGSNSCNLIGQGMDLKRVTSYLLNYVQRPNGTYWMYGQVGSGGTFVTKYLADESYEDFGPQYTIYYPNVDGYNREWKVFPVDQEPSRYFGVKPDVTSTDGNNWATMYAGFGFIPSATTTKAYTVSKVDYALGVAVIKEISGDVPAQTPVLFLCASTDPESNKLTLLPPSTSNDVGVNYLQGNYYCNDVPESSGHRNVKEYNASGMRMLALDDNGKPAFVKANISYLPANKCYLAVSSSAPAVLKIVTEEEYVTGIEEVAAPDKKGEKVIYDLQGRRVQAPSKGLYIVNGKKVVIK